MARRCLALVLLAALLSISQTAAAQEPPPDEISRLLFEAYLDGPRKINTATILAASQIVADRGRESGFWKKVLAELKSGDEHSEINCVRILGNMLATDAAARDAIRRQKETGEIGAWIPSVRLGPEVVGELLERGQAADRFRIDHYTIALARARAPEARDFFASILRAEFATPDRSRIPGDVPAGRVYHLDTTRFHAAVGLAQLGDPAGIDWLIANSEDIQGDVSHGRPHGANNLASCCVAALRQLSDQRELTAKAEWESWWKTADRQVLSNRAVVLVDP